MKLVDSIYGTYTVEPVISELIDSAPVQRLKGIHQGGACYLVKPSWNVTRFEHSIGVMLLIRKLGGSLEEQIAGLLHDVSHTAFSHVIDYVLAEEEEDYHEQIYEQVIRASEIPHILDKYGFDLERIVLNHSCWTLLEQCSPSLCADRIDYTLRDLYTYGHINNQEVDDFIANLIVVDGIISTSSVAGAEWFVRAYYKEVIDFFLDPLNVYGSSVLTSVLKSAVERKALGLDDFLKTDQELMEQLQRLNDDSIQKQLATLHPHVNVRENENHYHIHKTNKLRLIDPHVYLDGTFQRISSLSKQVKKWNEEAQRRADRGAYVEVLSS
ncbi:HD domain-containing protein [Halalkalibacterium halodurans]|jgi:HD superfamily phosphohydrolase|uniref:HD/PDEase domain-containing protein n=1 Tax=Halalkalibacterium halodurans TaxID=86665 RepID=A0A0M0KLE3_ALKHA|nr:HD domain-containing protein [Halalkalibacterium halodurans]TPE70929.1 HD domain-containing protein [Halalkalibacterium halodurans]